MIHQVSLNYNCKCLKKHKQMEDISINVLVDAKQEYTRQLTNILTPQIFDGLKSVYNRSKKDESDLSVMMRFQKKLEDVPVWNQDIIDDETDRIIERTECDWLSDLITAVFVSNTKILTAVRVNSNAKNNIDLEIPKETKFIHRCYIESAREIYKNPFLFDDSKSVTSSDQQRNMRETLTIIKESIEEAVRKLLPVQSILKQYLTSQDDDDISTVVSHAPTIPDFLQINKDTEESETEETEEPEVLRQAETVEICRPETEETEETEELRQAETEELRRPETEETEEIRRPETEEIHRPETEESEVLHQPETEENISGGSKLDENKEEVQEDGDDLSSIGAHSSISNQLDDFEADVKGESQIDPELLDQTETEQPPDSEVINVDLGKSSETGGPEKIEKVNLEDYELVDKPKHQPENSSTFGKFLNIFSGLNQEYTDEELSKMKKEEVVEKIVPTKQHIVEPEHTELEENTTKTINLSEVAPKGGEPESKSEVPSQPEPESKPEPEPEPEPKSEPKNVPPLREQPRSTSSRSRPHPHRRPRIIRSKRRFLIRRRKRPNVATIESKEPNLEHTGEVNHAPQLGEEPKHIVQVASIKSTPTFFDDAATTLDD